MRLALILLILTGCNQGFLEPGETMCSADGITLQFEFKADCAKVARNVSLAKKMAIEYKLVAVDGTVGHDFEAVYRDTEIKIEAVEDLGCLVKNPDGSCKTFLWGEYGYGNTIRSQCSTKILLHELAHRIEHLSFGYCTDHQHWANWNWVEADRKFQELAEDVCWL